MKIRVTTRPSNPREQGSIRLLPARIVVQHRPMKVLDFDIENRPLSYLGSDFTTAEVTAISWAWVDRPQEVTVYLLGETELPEILREFVKVYDAADMVTGHYILGHDLPMVNGALMEFQMAPLSDKFVQDTKVGLMRAKGLSKSQESLGAMFQLGSPKVQMNQPRWRAANRLTPEGLAAVRERVVGDVRQHIELRAKLLELGYLGAPVKWKSGSGTNDTTYTP
jgi:hypothetical protein